MSDVATCEPETAQSRPLAFARFRHPGWWPSVAIVSALVLVLWAPRLNGPIDLRYDAGVYYLLGSSLAKGDGYRLGNEPGAPVGIQYPPGLPALVALHQFVLGTTEWEVVAPVLRRTYALLFLGFGIATLALSRRFLGGLGALAATALCLLQAKTFLLADMLFTELPFALLSVGLALLLMSERLSRHPAAREGLCFLVAAVAFMVRTAGVALLFAWVVEAAMRRRWRVVVGRVLLAALPFLLWQVHVMRVRASDEYRTPAYEYQRASYQFYNVSYGENLTLIDPFQPELGRVNAGILVGRLGANLMALPRSLGEIVTQSAGFWSLAFDRVFGLESPIGGPPRPIVFVPLLLVAGLALGGLVVLTRQGDWFIASFCVATILLVCTTPWPSQFQRYLVVLCPFLAISALLGAGRVHQWALSRRGPAPRRISFALLGALFVSTGAVEAYALRNAYQARHHGVALDGRTEKTLTAPKWFYRDGPWLDWEAAVAWVGRHSAPEAVVATDVPHLAYLQMGRRTVLPPMEPDATETRRLLDTVPVSFVIVDQLDFIDVVRRYTEPALQADPEGWRLVHRIRETRIYERVRAGELRPGGAN